MKRRAILFLSLFLPASALAEMAAQPYPAVRYQRVTFQNPSPQQVHVATIDLTRPGVSVRVSRGGADPDGEGPWQTTLMRPTKVAEREGFDVVVNGDFFSHLSGKDAEGEAALKEFKGSTPARVSGPAATDGVVWSRGAKSSAIVWFDAANRPSLTTGAEPPSNARNAIHGHDVLVRGGKNVAPVAEKPGFVKGPHPRTAVGYTKDKKKLFLVVVDGRNKGTATGMSLSEVAEVFVQLGADEAVNLDGGGSSVMAIRDPKTGKMVIVNSPSDKDKAGVSHERAVGNVLGVTVTKRAK
jgi:hypothetical protein